MICLNEDILVQQTTTDYLKNNLNGKVRQGNNTVTFSWQSIGHEEFLIQMVKALDITIDRRP